MVSPSDGVFVFGDKKAKIAEQKPEMDASQMALEAASRMQAAADEASMVSLCSRDAAPNDLGAPAASFQSGR